MKPRKFSNFVRQSLMIEKCEEISLKRNVKPTGIALLHRSR